MYFKVNNKLIDIKTYKELKKLFKKILNDDIYLLINNKHYTSISSEEKFKKLPLINEISISYKIRGGFIGKIVEVLVGIYNINISFFSIF